MFMKKNKEIDQTYQSKEMHTNMDRYLNELDTEVCPKCIGYSVA